jgi:crossover junction endodeoxyribonuclease RuvC
MRILGIDPGSQRTGVGIVDADATGRAVHVYHAPVVLLEAESFPLRLKKLLDELGAIIERYRPDEVAIEKVFMARNPDSALKLGQARGAAMCAAVLRDLPVHEYAAKEIKLAVVGKGGAEKVQIQHMVGVMLNLHGKIQADAADALAVAITHAHVRATAARIGVSAKQVWSRK